MKKIFPVAAALVLALAGCGGAANKAEEPAEEPEAVEEAATEEEATEEGDQGNIIEWVDATSADEAAKGAGFDKFGVVKSFKLGDLEFANPTFQYAGGVAQATYETPATAVFLRKGVGSYTTPLSDRAVDEFPARWNNVFEGTDIACYGPARGAVTVATWTDGSKSYGLTFQGLGGDEMSMDVNELATLVKGINEANGDQDVTDEKKAEEKKAEEEKKVEEKQQETTTKSALLSDRDAEALVEKTCGGTCTAIDRVTTKQYGECWYATAVDSKGTKYEYYVNNDGIYEISKTESAVKEQQQQQQQTTGGHYEGEPVTIYDSIYAEWHQANGAWYATFVTYNGTQIFAQTAPAGGGWVFYAFTNGQQVQVIYSDSEAVGPAGVSSHWQSLEGNAWY